MEQVAQLEKEKSLLTRISRAIFGKVTPDLFARVVVYIGMSGWMLFFFWGLITFVATFFIDEMDYANRSRAVFNRFGIQYGIEDFLYSLKNYTIVYLISMIFVFVGLVLLWRQKFIGYVVYFGGYGAAILTLPLFMGFEYMWKETSMFDKILYCIVTMPYVVLFLYQIRKKAKQREQVALEKEASQS